MSVFSTTHDHLLQGVPFIVATYRTFLLRGLSNGFLFDRTLRMCSCCARSALKGRLDPSSHRPADLRSDRLSFGQFSDKYRLIQQRKRDRLFFCVREIRRHGWQWVAQANVFEGLKKNDIKKIKKYDPKSFSQYVWHQSTRISKKRYLQR